MRRCDLLIEQVRLDTQNETEGTEDGLSDETIIRRLNEGIRRVASAIIKAHRPALTKEWEFSAPGVDYKTVPSDIWARHRVRTVEYSSSGNDRDFYKLAHRELSERHTVQGSPTAYHLLGSSIYFSPYPSTGTFRVTYDPLVAKIDKRRAKVSAATTGAGALTALTLTTTSPFVQTDFDLSDELTVVDAQGTIKMSGIPYTAVSALGVVSILNSSYTYPAGSTIAANDWVVLGKNASSHSELPDQCEDFIVNYAARRVFQSDRSSESRELKADEMEMLADIVDAFVEIAADVHEIPVVWDYDFEA